MCGALELDSLFPLAGLQPLLFQAFPQLIQDPGNLKPRSWLAVQKWAVPVNLLFIRLGGARRLAWDVHQPRLLQRRNRNLGAVSAQTTLPALRIDVCMMGDSTPVLPAKRPVDFVLVRIQLRHCIVSLATLFYPARCLLLHLI